MHITMTEKEISVRIGMYRSDELPPLEKRLAEDAREASRSAYCPYSHFSVGAAVYLDNGQTVCASNQENVAFPSGLCAERTAMFYANARYPQARPVAIAIAASSGGEFTARPVSPCGACRQALAESERRFGQAIKVIMYGAQESYVAASVASLLPLCFDSL